MNHSTGKDQEAGNSMSLKEKAARANTALWQQSLRNISRARTRLLVCFWTLPVYVVAVWMLLNNGRDVDAFMWIYIGVYALFAIDMVRRRCPRCKQQFFVKTILLNLVTHNCVHCQQALKPTDASSDN